MLFNIHNNEIRFCTEIVPLFSEYSTFKIPKIYSTQVFTLINNEQSLTNGYILMEDMKFNKNIASISLFDGLTKAQIESGICALANFHANSLLISPDLCETFLLQADFEINVKYFNFSKKKIFFCRILCSILAIV